MGLVSRLRDRVRRFRVNRRTSSPTAPLREFVYLDEVSVYSLLVSRKGSVATNFTESQTASLNSGASTSFGVGIGATKAGLTSDSRTSRVQSSQVARKALIQTSFKELYDTERESLILTPPESNQVPAIESMDDLTQDLDELIAAGWIVDMSSMNRGQLLEAEIELEAEPIYRVASVIAAVREITEENVQLFDGTVAAHIPQMRSIATLLESLLDGLVPIRGRLVHYRSISLGDRTLLVHHLVLQQIANASALASHPAFVVGVAQRDLFWKDIRRVLFSKAQYTVLCRLAVAGITKEWNPVKLADVLTEVVPEFNEGIRTFSETAGGAMKAGVNATARQQDRDEPAELVRTYATLLTEHHGVSVEATVLDRIAQRSMVTQDWTTSVESRRLVLAKVTEGIDEHLGVETSREVAHDLRMASAARTNVARGLRTRSLGHESYESPGRECEERFLDTEIVAIYW